MSNETNTTDAGDKPQTDAERQRCGLVMPISDMPGYQPGHWSDVRIILEEAILAAGFAPNVVSNANEVTVIQKTIVQNLAENPIVVCDVSGKNPNVMFELGLRLAFDKPTIIVQDDATKYIFDIGSMEHLPYPADLRYSRIKAFKALLAEKIAGTMAASKADPDYSPFIRHFGKYKVSQLDVHETTPLNLVINEMREIKQLLEAKKFANAAGPRWIPNTPLPIAPAAEGLRARRIMRQTLREFFDSIPADTPLFIRKIQLEKHARAVFPDADPDALAHVVGNVVARYEAMNAPRGDDG